ncbi:MAG: DNA gyrase inhibitor YacG, partial [Pseudomonadota bacterium]|nr:DNA gyrase inhibitor YacG [Pseudomonadota bacterium]
MAGGAALVRLRPRRPCPICRKASVRQFHPFCSKHCSDIDLNRWLGGKYAIPSDEPEQEAEERA